MRKLFLLIVLLLVMVSSSFAFSLGDIVGLVTNLNNKPSVNLDSPSEGHIYPTDAPLVKWTFSDEDGDKQTAYLIAIATDYQFSDSEYIGGTNDISERKVKLRKGEGTYWVRVKAKDEYQWSEWSNFRSFYIDLNPKKCPDGTDFWQCSIDVPFYCDGGDLVEDCMQCGCPINTVCQPIGRCFELTCRDRTKYGECSKNQPFYCQAGNLIEICSLCGCPKGQTCQTDGTCSAIILITTKEEPSITPISILERIALFFKGLLGR